jgi:hypothetical protein
MINLRRNGELKKVEALSLLRHDQAISFYYHIAHYLQNKLGAEIPHVSCWLDKNAFPHAGYGKIVLFDEAKNSEVILNNEYLSNFSPSIIEGANSSLDTDQRSKKHKLTILSSEISNIVSTDKNGWTSYSECVSDFEVKYGRTRGIREINNQLVDYVLLKMEDPSTNEPLLIEMGNLPVIKQSLTKRIISSVIPLNPIKNKNYPTILISK